MVQLLVLIKKEGDNQSEFNYNYFRFSPSKKIKDIVTKEGSIYFSPFMGSHKDFTKNIDQVIIVINFLIMEHLEKNINVTFFIGGIY